MKAFVTGAMGFLGTHLVTRLLADQWDVTVYDRKPRPNAFEPNYIVGDVCDISKLGVAMQRVQPDLVFHLAALADVRNALKQPQEQVKQNLLATFTVLEAMKVAEVKRIAFTSTAVVYGDTQSNECGFITPMLGDITARPRPIRERRGIFPQQTSIYGAMKLASESLIAAYCEGFGMSADIYRLVSVIGAGYRHGNLMDFYQRLKTDPTKLVLLGSPSQEKYYIAAQDVIDAIALTVAQSHAGAELWNLSHHAPSTIADSIDAVCEALSISPERVTGDQPWAGDLPQLVLDCSKLRALGWMPKVDIRDAMRATVRDFVDRGL